MPVIVIYVVVAQTAEQIRAESNYIYNKNLENKGQGVEHGSYITDQSSTATGYASAYYRFGFTTFSGVGCEVAATYNAMVSYGRDVMLSEVIYDFEKWSIEFAVGWGYLGSNPRQIYRYLRKLGYSYNAFTNFSSFEGAVMMAPNGARIIMSRWNKNKSNGLHTFYVYKVNDDSFLSYNWKYSTGCRTHSSIDVLNDGSGFIVGYILQ